MSENTTQQQPVQDDEIDLMNIATTLIQQKYWIIGCASGAGVIALIVSLLMTPVYTATTTILPPQQGSSSIAAALGSLGTLAGVAGGITALKNPNDLYVGMLQSQTIADRLIKQFDLRGHYQQETMVGTRKALASVSNINAGKDGLISVSVDDENSLFAANLANAYITELKKLNQNLAITDAAQRRLFFEKQLERVKEDLAKSEINLKQTQEKTGLLLPEGQIKTIIDNVAMLKAQIAAKEVQLAAMRSFATEENPEFMRVQQSLKAMRMQLMSLEKGQQASGDLVVPTGKIPETALEYVRARREQKYQEILFELMSKQFEVARLDEVRDSSIIQVLDVAVAPDYKSKPNRTIVTMLGLVVGFFIGAFVALTKGKWRQTSVHYG